MQILVLTLNFPHPQSLVLPLVLSCPLPTWEFQIVDQLEKDIHLDSYIELLLLYLSAQLLEGAVPATSKVTVLEALLLLPASWLLWRRLRMTMMNSILHPQMAHYALHINKDIHLHYRVLHYYRGKTRALLDIGKCQEVQMENHIY